MRHHSVAGGGGVLLHVVETGAPDRPPIVFIHGWSQSHFCWHRQLEAPELRDRFRLVALDLRGHGESGKPTTGYDDSSLWAADIAAVIAELKLDRPALVGWSYGGYVICDYVREHGDSHIAAINFVDASTDIGVKMAYRKGRSAGWDGLLPGPDPAAPHAFSDDAQAAFGVMQTFLRRCVVSPLPYLESLALLATNLRVPPAVRQALLERKLANDDVLGRLRVPVLVTHGEDDIIIEPATARHLASTIPDAALSLYARCGHAPFLEHTDRFNDELSAFTGSAASVHPNLE